MAIWLVSRTTTPLPISLLEQQDVFDLEARSRDAPESQSPASESPRVSLRRSRIGRCERGPCVCVCVACACQMCVSSAWGCTDVPRRQRATYGHMGSHVLLLQACWAGFTQPSLCVCDCTHSIVCVCVCSSAAFLLFVRQ